MKNYFKSKAIKRGIGILGILLIMPAAVNAADVIEYFNEGDISFAGEQQKATVGSDVSISIVKSGYDYDEEKQWIKAEAENVVYYGNSKIMNDGKYSFNFNLDENGLYDVYVGFDNLNAPDIFKIEYINKTAHEAAVERFKKAIQTGSKTDIEELLKNNRTDLRIYTDLYSDEACPKAAELIYSYFKKSGIDAVDGNSVKEITQLAFAIDKINDKTITDIDRYKDILKLSEGSISKYYSSKNEADIINMLRQKTIASIEEYNDRMTEAVLVSAINNCDGIQVIKNALSDYRTECGTVNREVTDKLCYAVADKGDFDSLAELKTFVSNYKEKTDSGSTSGGSTGSSTRKNDSVIIAPNDNQKNDKVQVKIFDDIASDFWANEAIEELYKKNIVAGKTDSMFYPNDNIKREEFVTLLVKAFKFDMVDDDFHFEDVPEGAWYYDYVRSAYLGYVVKGISENMFGSGMDITRQDLSVMIYNAAKSAGVILPETKEKINFADEDDIAEYAKAAVENLQKAGIVSGYEDGTFKPAGNATRAEAAMMIYRVMQYIK